MSISDQLDSIAASVDDLKLDIDNLWVLTSAAIVFFMQAGFCLLETGCIRPKNLNNSLIKNMIDCVIGAMAYYLIGFGLAFGDLDKKFAGHKYFAGSDFKDTYLYTLWMFEFAFASTSATIVSGAVSERITLFSYMIYSALFNAVVYPIISGWVWGNGWLANMEPPYIDFSGSGVVHITGGFSSLVAVLLLGRRFGRFEEETVEFDDPLSKKRVRATVNPKEFSGTSQVYAVTGVFILWLGWLFFNAGSTMSFTGSNSKLTGKIMMNTSLGGAAGGLTVFFLINPLFDLILKRKHSGPFRPGYDIGALNNGILVGLVAITAGCANMQQWAAIIIGSIGGFAYIFGKMLGEFLKIDDPLDTIYIHGCGGIVGVILPGFLDQTHGVIYGGDGTQIGIQLLGMVAIMAWSGIGTFIIFGVCKYFGKLRMPVYAEIYGLDLVDNGVYAVNSKIYIPKITILDEDKNGITNFIEQRLGEKQKIKADNQKESMNIIRHMKSFDYDN